MALTLAVGYAPPALVQTGSIIQTSGQLAVGTLPVASSSGTTIVAVLAAGSDVGLGIRTAPSGWRPFTAIMETNSDVEIWVNFNNPGGIQSASFLAELAASPWSVHLSEWRNCDPTGPVNQIIGSATATSGTTLPLSSVYVTDQPGTILPVNGSVVIAAWIQALAAPNTATFTSPSGFTRLTDNGSSNASNHLDIEYQINPRKDVPMTPTLVSNRTTSSAAGFVVAIPAGRPSTDLSAYLAY